MSRQSLSRFVVTTAHQPEFVFPYSHGLLAAIVWSAPAGAAIFLWQPRLNAAKLRAAAFVALAVFSHWILDALVHDPELQLAGKSSLKVSLGLLQNMPVALVVEALVTVGGLCLFFSGTKLSSARKLWLSALSHSTFHTGIYGCWNDDRTSSALGHGHLCKLVSHHRRRLRACQLA